MVLPGGNDHVLPSVEPEMPVPMNGIYGERSLPAVAGGILYPEADQPVHVLITKKELTVLHVQMQPGGNQLSTQKYTTTVEQFGLVVPLFPWYQE